MIFLVKFLYKYNFRMYCLGVMLVFLVSEVLSQGPGSGNDGKLRLCIVETRGSFKRSQMYCPVLDSDNGDVECVLGTDRLDCLRRISKGTVDFGVFSPEDLVAAQWAGLDVLVTNEIRHWETKPYERSVVALVNRRILPSSSSTLHAVLRNSTLCHPGVGADHLRPLSDTLSGYLESLVLERSCDPSLSIAENRVKALSGFFGSACRAGPWLADPQRDAELKEKYPSLCAACSSPSRCASSDRYWGDSGALQCVADGAGDVAWAEYDDVSKYFGFNKQARDTNVYPPSEGLAALCRDGTWQELTGAEPCVWLHRPWNVVVAKRKAAAAVVTLTSTLTNSSITSDQGWRGALASLLESNTALRQPLSPPSPPGDYLARARGFREAYSQSGCDPPRHITLCTTSQLEKHKCEWMSEAGAVYGVTPPVQCTYRVTREECMRAVGTGGADVAVGGSDWIVKGSRDYSITPILHEVTPIIEKTNTIIAYVKKGGNINKMADLRNKRAAFPRFDGVAWHSVLSYITDKEKISCKEFSSNYFKEVCAPGAEGEIENANCYGDGEKMALTSLLEGKSDVAFIDMETYKRMAENQTTATALQEIVPLCPEENQKYCYIGWSAVGHIFASKNNTAMRRQEIINVLGHLDKLFGRNYPFRTPMFAMYGLFNHQANILFHSNTKSLAREAIFGTHPYDSMPLNFERRFFNLTDFACGFGAKSTPSFIVLAVSLLSVIISRV